VLLVAGALVADGRFAPAPTVAAVVLACLFADTAWFALGRRRGNAVLRVLCRTEAGRLVGSVQDTRRVTPGAPVPIVRSL
jgi:membrane protein DedA with SNARE-associated domain